MVTRPSSFILVVLSTFLLLALPGTALAHIQLSEPAARTTEQKAGPCGLNGGTRGDTVTTFEAGQTITLRWAETVNHPSHYRIAFDVDGQDDLVDPEALDDYYTNDAVLLDEIPDKDGGLYESTVTLPDVECDNCTLQLIQVMYDKAPPLAPNQVYGDNDIYYQCADLVLVASGEDTGGDVAEPEDMGMQPDADSDTSSDTSADVSVDAPEADPATDTSLPSDMQSDLSGMEEEPDSDDGCGCSLSRTAPAPTSGAILLLFLAIVFGLRRRSAEI